MRSVACTDANTRAWQRPLGCRQTQNSQKKVVKSAAFKSKKKKQNEQKSDKALAVMERLEAQVGKRDSKECPLGNAGLH